VSVSTSLVVKQLKEQLGVDTNAGVLEKVQGLLAKEAIPPAPLVVAVQWRPGEPANVNVLSGDGVMIQDVAEALRAGQATVEHQLAQIAAQAQRESARLREQLREKEEKGQQEQEP